MNKLIFTFLALTLLACSQPNSNETNKIKNAPQTNVENTDQPKEVVELYKNGVVKIKGKELNGKRIGTWQSFYENGYKWSETNYKNGFHDGPIIVYYKNGMMRYDGRYYSDERSGLWQFYDTSGVLIKRIDMDVVETVPDSLFR